MRTALIIGNGQIGSEIATQLTESGVAVRIATRSGGGATEVGASGAGLSDDAESGTISEALPGGTHPDGTLPVQSTNPSSGSTTVCAPDHVKADASDRAQLAEAATGVDVIFACAHAPYDSRKWEQILPRLDAAILDTAAELDIPVVFPESVYAFAGLNSPITESSPFAPVEDKGLIRQRLLEARSAHSATSASIIAGDLFGRTAENWSSVVPTSAASSPGVMTQGSYQIGASRLSSKKERSNAPMARVAQRGIEIGRLCFRPRMSAVKSAISARLGFDAGAMNSRCVPAGTSPRRSAARIIAAA